MLHAKMLMTTIAATLAVAGCGSSNDGPAVVSAPAATRLYSDTDGAAAAALAAGKTLTAQTGSTSALALGYDTGATAVADSTFSVRKNASGALTFVVNGVEQAFTPADIETEDDGDVYGYNIEDDAASKYVNFGSRYGGQLSEVLDPAARNYVQVWGYQSNQITPNGPDLRGFAVVGTETRPGALAALPTATYRGYARVDSVPATGFVDNGTSRTSTEGDLTLTANFGAGTVAGQLDELRTRAPGLDDFQPSAGVIALNQTAITGAGFTGTVSADAAFTAGSGATLAPTSRYSGAFYGAAAQQVGGTIAVTGTDEDGAFNGAGFFVGDDNN